MADTPTGTDKNGNQIEVGDTVDFVFGGDYFRFVVESIEHGSMGYVESVTGTVGLTVPSASTTLCAKGEKPKKGSK